MGFGFFMLIMDVLIPITMIEFGKFFLKQAPKKINTAFGYRTSMSMKNNDTVGTMGAIVCFIQMLPLVGAIVPTEKALHKLFDNNGNRR